MTRSGRIGAIRMLLPLLVTVAFGTSVSAQDANSSEGGVDERSEDIRTSELFAQVSLLQAEVELLRLEMGADENTQPDIAISGAQPHEVFFQALTMFRKADQLCFEQTRQRAIAPELPPGEISPSQIMEVVNRALERVRLVKSRLDVREESTTVPGDSGRTLTDVFRSIVRANRQLNQLLQRRFQPADVFQQVTLAVGYCSQLLEQFPPATRLPKSPDFERRKRPADVYQRLVDCHRLLSSIAGRSGVDLVRLEVSEEGLAQVTPSDVYDVASLLVSELAYLHGRLPNARAPRRTYNPGNKLPSHVYQRAGMLERQLLELDKLVEASPDWLRPSEDQP